MQQAYLDTLKAVRTQFDDKVKTFQQQQGVMDQAARAKEEEQLNQMQQRMQAYQQAHLGPQGTVVQKQAELVEPIRQRVLKAIEAIAKSENLDAVMEKGEGGFLYVDKKLDITFKVLDYINQNTGG